MKCTTVFLRGARRVSFTLGTLFALCLMAFASMGGTASAHTMPSNHHVTVNAQFCNQSVPSKAKYVAHTKTKQVQVCVLIGKLSLNFGPQKGPMPVVWSGDNKGSHTSHVQINAQLCNQSTRSKTKYVAHTETKQVQVCVLIGKLSLNAGPVPPAPVP